MIDGPEVEQAEVPGSDMQDAPPSVKKVGKDVTVSAEDVTVTKEQSWKQSGKALDEMRSKLSPGFELGAPKTAASPLPMERSAQETVEAAMRQGLTADIFNQTDRDVAPADPEFNVYEYMRPQDYQYISAFALVPSFEKVQELQEEVDKRNNDYAVMSARPWLSFMASMADPATLAIDAATFGVGHALTVPLLANTLRRTQAGIKSFEAMQAYPRIAKAAREAVVGAQAGSASIYTQEQIKADVNALNSLEDIGTHTFFGGLVGGLLGGAVGLMGRSKTQRLTNEFIEGNNVTQHASRAPEDFVGPQKPAAQPKFDMRAHLKEEPVIKKTPEEIRSAAAAFEREVTVGSEPIRAAEYSNLRQKLSYIGESLVKKDGVMGAAWRLVSAPVRKMSATNRLIDSPFGVARLKALFTARNATEFIGAREGFIIPRPAQNRIEDLSNQAVGAQVELANMFLKANGLEPGVAASEKLLLQNRLGTTKWKEADFFNAVSDEMLHIGRPSQKTRNSDPHVQEAAQHAYDNIYQPLSEILKEYKLIDPSAGMDESINYLNRLWSSKKLLSDPEAFKKWLADYYSEVNEELKSIMPAYNNELKDVRNLNSLSRRFEKAADKIDKLKEQLEKSEQLQDKMQSVSIEKEQFEAATTEKYNKQRDAIAEKYKDKKPSADGLKKAKQSLKSEIASSVKERDTLAEPFNKQIKQTTTELKDIRDSLKRTKDSIKSGARDSEIKTEFRKEEVERISANQDLTQEQIELQASDSVAALDSFMLDNLRANKIREEIENVIGKTEELKLKRALLREEKSTVIKPAEEKLDNAISKAKDAASLKDVKDLELKIVDLKESKDSAVFAVKHLQRINDIMKPVLQLEALQRQYSRKGFEAYATRRGAEKMTKSPFMAHLDEAGIKKMINESRRREAATIKKLPVVDEARIMAKELEEDAAALLERAEEMIPDRFRSSETNRPYKTWESGNKEYPYNLAEKSFYTMIGQDDEMVMNPVFAALGGKPGMFKPRSIKMPDNYPGIENWAERDIRVLINNFTNGVAPAIARTEMMQELNQLPIIQQTIRRMQVADKRIGAAKAMNMPAQMTHYTEIPKVVGTALREEYRLMSKGLKGEELEKLNKAYKQAEKNLLTQDQQIDGIFGNGANINSKGISDFIALGNSLASTVTNNNIVISMLSGLMSNTLRYGLKDWFTKGLTPYLTDPFVKGLSKKQARSLDTALNVGKGSIIKNRMVGREGSLRNSKFGRVIGNVQNRLGNITGANGLQDFLDNSTVCLLQTEMLELAEKASKGTLTAKEKTHLAQRSMSPEKVAGIYEVYRRYGWKKKGSRGIDPSKMEFIDPEMAKSYSDFQNLISDELAVSQGKPGVGSMPDFAYTPAGEAVMFLKRWFFAATNDVFIPAVQRADKEALEGFLGLFAMGALQAQIRRSYRGEELKEFNTEGFITEALTNSGILGIGSFGLDLALTSGMLAGMGGARYDPSNGMASILVGPGVLGYSEKTLNILGKLRKIATDEDRQFSYNDWNYMANTAIPLYKWAPLAAIVKPNVKQYFEDMGRGQPEK